MSMEADGTATRSGRKRSEARRSLSLLATLDLAGIIRSSSLTSRRVSDHEEGKPRTYRRGSRRVTVHYEMEPGLTIERPASVTSKDKGEDEHHDVVPELPSSPTKPPVQSRPLSATSSTVTPSKKRVPSRIPTKTEPSQKKHLFGIPLPSPVRSSFSSSRPTTPSDSPSTISKSKAKPKPPIGQGSASSLSKFFVAGGGSSLRVSSAPESQRKPSPSSKLPTPVKQHSPISPASPKRSSLAGKPSGAHISSSTIVVEPGSVTPRRLMSEVGNTTRAVESTTNYRSSVSVVASRPRTSAIPTPMRTSISNPRASLVAPAPSSPTVRVRSLSTGASSSRSAIGVSTRVSSNSLSTVSLSPRERRTSSDSSSHAHRPYRATVRLDGIAELKGKEGDNGELDAKHSASGHSRHVTVRSTIDAEPSSPMPAGTTTTTTAKSSLSTAASRKHGSFDFERPGWGSLAGKGASTSLGIGSRTRREAIGRDSSVDESGRIRTTGAGLAGVGSARFYASTSAASNRNVRLVPPPTPPELEPSHTGNSASTSASRTNVGTSSWGRSTGKRLSAGFSKLTTGLGLGGKSVLSKTSTANVGKERHHGKFPFEPPVSSPTMVARQLSLDSQHDRERVSRPLSPGSKGHNASHSTSSTTSSTHTGVSAGHRSGTKGRSLDLGLGLAWAPTRVREDAVMPESSFGRSLSASRRERRGKEIAEEFRQVLDDDGFKAFKKYVHRFDNNEIPFDGPTGIVARVERLLRKARQLDDDERSRLLDNFVKLTLSAV
ncbi:hypothetical protein MIND_00753900 [Mycena indigotica]|uniref:Uncharacterized protein n=1 Tax=Mycena indigotica TaxID=2126181 RepID=A0A8H6SLC6_9AGAR|nr:uncharacterized protein MIND_00753900 [Mycena indigotica]KAF7301880.1 hypothetical protein MIND_00753900 [Mycena indigotica]